MWKTPLFIIVIMLATVLQISFFSQLSFPFSAFSFPIAGIAYGIVRDRPLASAGWALIGGFMLDLHGLLGFGAELFALFISFFSVRFLFRRVLTNAGTGPLFLLGAAAAVTHWFALVVLDGANVLFGGIPVMIDASVASMLAPLRQGLVAGVALCMLVGLERLISRRFRKTFLSHAPQALS